MSFSTTPKAAPTINTPPQSSARDRAIAMLNQAQAAPIANPSQVAVEELGAIAQGDKTVSEPPSEVEPKAAAAEAPKTEQPPLSAQYAQLARKEKALRAQAQAVKAQAEAFKTQQAELERSFEAKLAEAQKNWQKRLSENPLEVMSEANLSYDQVTNLMLNQPKPEQMEYQRQIKALEAKLQAIEDATKQTNTRFEENQTNAYKQAVNQIKVDVTSMVSTGDDFELIRETNSIGDVVELIERTFKEEGFIMTNEEAARAVEEHLVEEAMKIAKLKKLQQKLAPPTPKEEPKQLEAKQKQSQPLKTLTNAVGSSRPLTSKERAILAFKGELPK